MNREMTNAQINDNQRNDTRTLDPAQQLNRDCQCISLDRELLAQSMVEQLGPQHGHLFAELPVFVARQHVDSMAQVVAAITALSLESRYRTAVLSIAPEIANIDPGTEGVFYGFDFHLTEDGPWLIEVNTNAGGALLNNHLARAQRACCEAVAELFPIGGEAALEQVFVDMFRREWQAFRAEGSQELSRIAIVDEQPEQQFLYPEFELFAKLFRAHDIEAVVCDPSELRSERGHLFHRDRPDAAIDLVYNRLTDFYLADPSSRSLRRAFEARAMALTPAPWHHALLADKRNLAVFSSAQRLAELGLDPRHAAALVAHVPRTRIVRDEADPSALWAERKTVFFKPASGHGSRGTYDGGKLTRKVFEQILEQDYVVQDKVSPSLRRMTIDGEEQLLKVDLRAVVYRSEIQQVSARLYRGQTTNLRTPGGGLATVFTTRSD